jgi:two-component system sensor histidine kinase KdpD
LIGSALRHMKTRLQNRKVKTRAAADLPLVFIDGLAVEQILVNLIDNAIEHAPSDTPIEIEAKATDSELVVEVADRGPGLPAGAEARLFDKFFHAASPGTTAHKGLGLGLAICQSIAKAHGGEIVASNRPGGGAVFRLSLPRQGCAPHVDGTE